MMPEKYEKGIEINGVTYLVEFVRKDLIDRELKQISKLTKVLWIVVILACLTLGGLWFRILSNPVKIERLEHVNPN